MTQVLPFSTAPITVTTDEVVAKAAVLDPKPQVSLDLQSLFSQLYSSIYVHTPLFLLSSDAKHTGRIFSVMGLMDNPCAASESVLLNAVMAMGGLCGSTLLYMFLIRNCEYYPPVWMGCS